MAFVNSTAAGSFRGKVGDKIYRNVNGKTVVGQAPGFINVSHSQGCLNSRFRFKITEELAKSVKTNELLYGLWHKVKPEGANKFSRIMKANLRHTTLKGLSSGNVISPRSESVPYRFRRNCTRLSVKSIGINNGCVFADVKVHRNNSDILAPPYTAYFLIYLGKQNGYETHPRYKYLGFNIDVTEENMQEYQHHEIMFDEETKRLISNYSYATVLYALVKINDVTNKYEWSHTESAEVVFNRNSE